MPTVFANSIQVGSLERAFPAHLFTYAKNARPSDAVSLLMPVGENAIYPSDRPARLHPVFDMNLPEGALRRTLELLFAKALPLFDEFALLEIIGRSLVGRLRFSAGTQAPPLKPQNLKSLLAARGTQELFKGLVERYAEFSGISGVQPKLLIGDDGSLGASPFSPALIPAQRVTFPGTTHIVKAFDPNEYPDMAVNEFICLQAAAKAGLSVPTVNLAADQGLLVVSRFDLKPDGSYLAFEDGCSLHGRVSTEKYEGSYEQLARTFAKVIKTPDGTADALRAFFKTVVLSVIVRNGDAHLKNFGVLYADATSLVNIAPVYDIITTTVYQPADRMALSLYGDKRWPDARRLLRFGLTRCQLSEREAAAAIDEVAQAVSQTRSAHEQIKDATVRARMQKAWEEGLNGCALQPRIRAVPAAGKREPADHASRAPLGPRLSL